MKKNFFKKLATVLSLAMVVTSVAPLAGTSASAAATPDIKTRRTTAYEGNSYSYAVKNAKGYTVKWAVSGKLATISKAGKLTVKTKGAKAGKVVVSATFYKKGKKVVTRKDSVAIKVSAKSVTIATKDAADLTAVPAGEVIDFNRKLSPANATSKTYYSVTAKDGSATTTATVDAAGKFTATAVGEYVVTATVRNAKTSKVLTTVDQAITVINAVKDVKQTHVNKVNVTFSAEASKTVTKDNLTIVNDKKVKQVVKSVSFDATGKIATVETYLEFAKDVVYTVSYDKSSVDFTAKKGDVAKVVVTGKEIAVNEKTELSVALFDENGIDITTDDLKKKVDLTTDKGWIDGGQGTAKKEITMFNVGDVATVTATYHTGSYTNGVENKVVSEKATFTCVKEINVNGTLTAYTLATGTPDWSKTNTTVPVDVTYKAYVKMKDATSGDIIESQYKPAKFTFESTDSNTLLVYNDGSVKGVKAGTAYVKVTYGKTVEMFAVTVGEKSKAASISVDKASLTLSSSTAFTDVVDIKVTTKDQYGNDMSGQVTVDKIDTANGGTFASATATTPATDTVRLTYNSTNVSNKDGYKLTLKKDDLFVVVNVDVKAPSEYTLTDASVRFDVSSTDVDMKYTKAGDAKTISLTPYWYAKNGVRINVATAADITIEDKDGKTISATPRLAADGLTATDNDAKVSGLTGAVTFSATYPVVTASGSSIVKAKTGTYKVTAKISGTSKATASFTLKDTQVLPALTIDKSVTSVNKTQAVSGSALTTLVTNAVNELFTVKLAGSDVDETITAVDYTTAASSFTDIAKSYNVYIKTITINDTAADGSSVPCVVTVNAYITISGN